MNQGPSNWESSKGIAKAILYDRKTRRKWIARCMLLTVGWMAIGLWVVDDWLGEDPLRFLIWWGICGVLAIILVIFALYDALSVASEERSNR